MDIDAHLYPVGRLDKPSTGLILLTNDGQLAHKLTHPRYGHEKEYRVWCAEGTLRDADVRRLLGGVQLDDGPARATRARSATDGALVVLQEGRNRQVRRMFEAVGYTVERLLRTRIAGLLLDDLEPGAWRELTAADLGKLGYTAGRSRDGSRSSEIPDSE